MSEFTVDGERVCPHADNGGQPHATERHCWWIADGHPHGGGGHGCICLVPPDVWVEHCEVNIFSSAVCDRGTKGCAGEWHP